MWSTTTLDVVVDIALYLKMLVQPRHFPLKSSTHHAARDLFDHACREDVSPNGFAEFF
jgi:hypothetical protein